ncbi:response regulator transcription factor [Kallotenue papyrolyticum]|uniref:response regulator transcription factor n=1 Tax=Kallotenue papyrolyticum TaxID=1325125 RepID=UPI000492629C|nr:response regulator transcription factor [Kallotenue papyrolyticum]
MPDRSAPLSIPPGGEHRYTVALRCGMPALERLLVQQLAPFGIQHDPASATLLLVDAPFGFALLTLETLEHSYRYVIVATENPCPEYWEDLDAFQPTILLAGCNLEQPIAEAIARVATGDRYRMTPQQTTPLTASERAVLRLVARGWTNKQIARCLGVTEKRVANTLTGVYEKLRLHSRVALALYYWGRQDVLDDILRPAPSQACPWSAGESSRCDGNKLSCAGGD